MARRPPSKTVRGCVVGTAREVSFRRARMVVSRPSAWTAFGMLTSGCRGGAVTVSMQKALVGLVPWLVSSAMATRGGVGAVGAAAVLAFLVALGLVIRSTVRGESVKLLEVIAVVVFGGYALVALLDPSADAFLADYGRALAALLLAAVIFVVLPVLPFTEQYARESVPREYWHTPEFRSVNRRISAVWGGVVAVMAVSHAL